MVERARERPAVAPLHGAQHHGRVQRLVVDVVVHEPNNRSAVLEVAHLATHGLAVQMAVVVLLDGVEAVVPTATLGSNVEAHASELSVRLETITRTVDRQTGDKIQPQPLVHLPAGIQAVVRAQHATRVTRLAPKAGRQLQLAVHEFHERIRQTDVVAWPLPLRQQVLQVPAVHAHGEVETLTTTARTEVHVRA